MTKISNLDEAFEIIKERRIKWKEEHPEENSEPVCEICNGTGLKMILRDEFGKIHPREDRYKPGMYEYFEPCPCTKSAMSTVMKNNRRFSSVPGLYADALIENFSKDVYKNMRSFELFHLAKNDAIRYITAFSEYEKLGTGLYIWSREKGSGKSRLASTISNELTRKGIRNKFASASGILSEIQATWDEKGTSESKIFEKYIAPRLLIIDDLGAKAGQQWINDKFFYLIDERYSNNKPTIITSNYEADKLPFDGRITDRICEADRFMTIHMPEESVRRNVKSDNGNKFREVYEKYMKEHQEG